MPLLLFLALLPTIFLIGYIYRMDSYEKEPLGLLAGLFGLGVLSIIPAIILELLGDVLIKVVLMPGTTIYNFVEAFLIVAVVEEGVKYFFTYIATWNNKNFNYKFDGIVYAVLVSLGFATLENIMYVLQGGLSTAIVRALLSVPSHAIDAVFMGYHYGFAKYYRAIGDEGNKSKHLILAYVVPVLLHGFFDFCLFEGNVITVIMFFIFVITLDVITIKKVSKSSKQNNQIYITNTQANQMYMEAAGNAYSQQGGAFGRTNQMFVNCRNCGTLVNVCTFYCARCGAPVRK